jgi:glutathione S-transferase
MPFIVYGPTYSTYTRTVRLTLEEKGASYELVEVDILSGKQPDPEHFARNPFGRVPAFAHDGFSLYETDAIIRYVDDVATGPNLVPGDAKARARMGQIIGIVNSYGYGSIIGKLFWQRCLVPMKGGQPDEKIVEGCLPQVRLCLTEIERIMGGGPWLAGAGLSLADLMVAPVIAYMTMAPEGSGLLGDRPGLGRWWQAMSARPSMARTAPKFG